MRMSPMAKSIQLAVPVPRSRSESKETVSQHIEIPGLALRPLDGGLLS